jgi:hypothetical protein
MNEPKIEPTARFKIVDHTRGRHGFQQTASRFRGLRIRVHHRPLPEPETPPEAVSVERLDPNPAVP